MWAVASAALLAWLVRRQGFNADTLSYVQVLAVLGVAIAWVLPLLCEPRGLPIRGYGMMMLLAVLSGMGLAAYRARRVGVDPEMIFALAFWMIVPGIVGARAVYVSEYWFRAILAGVHGERSAGLDLCHRQHCRRRAGRLRRVFRRHARAGVVLVAASRAAVGDGRSDRPQHALGPGPGRVGCLLNGCCYGGPCDLPWKVTFPWNSPVHQHEAEQGIDRRLRPEVSRRAGSIWP